MQEKILFLYNKIQPLADYSSQSRVHLLNSLTDAKMRCFVKRDDELSFGVSGSKVRKYLSLVPFLSQHRESEIILKGGSSSNHVLGLSQFLLEKKIVPTLFLRGEEDSSEGNQLFLSLLLPKKHIHWVAREAWRDVDTFIASYVKSLCPSRSSIIVPEGGALAEALPGALTLSLDLLRNSADYQVSWDHIFLEAGTGFMAMATLLSFAWLNSRSTLHIVLLLEDQARFLSRLEEMKKDFEALVGEKINVREALQRVKIYHPHQARSFGATNTNLFKEIILLARQEGFFTDPIYSGKLFIEARRIIQEEKLKGTAVIVHSGGGLTLSGFQPQLKKASSVLSKFFD